MTGETKDSGWQVGARRTLPLQLDEVWSLMTTRPWIQRWSGLDRIEDASSHTPGVVARVHGTHMVQLRVTDAATGTTVAFHEDQIPDEATRAERKAFWARFLDDLEAAAAAGS